MPKRATRQGVLAGIARREWLLQMLALSAAGCGRDRTRVSERPADAHGCLIASIRRTMDPGTEASR